MSKEDMLKPFMLEAAKRLVRLIEVDAPGVVIGHAAFSAFCTALSTYGEIAGNGLVQALRERNLQGRGVCNHEDCTEVVSRAPLGMCDPHMVEILGDTNLEEIP